MKDEVEMAPQIYSELLGRSENIYEVFYKLQILKIKNIWEY